MTRDEAKQLLPIIQAFADGKTVQAKDLPSDGWADLSEPCFLDPPDFYRIKPAPVECWAVVDMDGRVVAFQNNQRPDQGRLLSSDRIVRMVEA